MPTNKQREAERRRLQRQLEERRRKQAARKKFTLIASIVGTLVVIGAIIGLVLGLSGGSSNKTASTPSTSAPASTTISPSTATTSSAAAAPVPTAACTSLVGKATATFDGVTVSNPADLKAAPKITSKATGAPTTLQCADLVVGKGAAASPTATVTVQYAGVLYKDGTAFDASWVSNKGKPVKFPLTGVVPGFTQGIGGAGKVAPMRVGGRRIMILPAVLGYGSQAAGKIPANSDLVFVVDLTKIG